MSIVPQFPLACHGELLWKGNIWRPECWGGSSNLGPSFRQREKQMPKPWGMFKELGEASGAAGARQKWEEQRKIRVMTVAGVASLEHCRCLGLILRKMGNHRRLLGRVTACSDWHLQWSILLLSATGLQRRKGEAQRAAGEILQRCGPEVVMAGRGWSDENRQLWGLFS